MIDNRKIICIIPARGGSKGLSRKNIRSFCGKPLIAWPIAAALGSRYVDRVVVSTDDEEIAAVAHTYGADVPFLRPAELANDTASSFAVIEHTLNFLRERREQYDYLLLLEPTSPATESSDIDSAVETLAASRENADSIVGVAKLEGLHPVFMAKIRQ